MKPWMRREINKWEKYLESHHTRRTVELIPPEIQLGKLLQAHSCNLYSVKLYIEAQLVFDSQLADDDSYWKQVKNYLQSQLVNEIITE